MDNRTRCYDYSIMTRIGVCLALGMLSVALHVHAAAEIPAGFAPGQVWLSRSTPVEGETVEIFTVIYDASGSALEGSVTFLVDGEPVGASPFTLRGGKTEIRSVRWEATRGEHALTARVDSAIYAKSKQTAPLQHQTTGTSTILVAEREKTQEDASRSETSQMASTDIATAVRSLPIVGEAIGTVIDTTEAIRTTGASLVQQYATTTTASTSSDSDGTVLGTSTENIETKPVSLATHAASVALPAFKAPALFYPIAIILILSGFWLIARQLRNPNRARRRRR